MFGSPSIAPQHLFNQGKKWFRSQQSFRLPSAGFNQTHAPLKDGRYLFMRPIETSDDLSLLDIFHHLSPQSRFMRYHQLVQQPSEKWLRQAVTAATHLTPDKGFGLIAMVNDNGIIPVPAAAAYFVKEHDRQAEFAICVRDDFQKLGIGTLLMKRLSAEALQHGLTSLTALILHENIGMQRVVDCLPHKFDCRVSADVFEITVDLTSRKSDQPSHFTMSPFMMANLFS